jgi:hypothetical protein
LRLLSDELPPRTGEAIGRPAQRELTLATPPGPATAAAALAEACAIFDQVMAGTWRWPDPLAPAAHEASRLAPVTLARLRARLRLAVVGERITERTWSRTYQPYLLKLEQVAGLQAWPEDADLLAAALRHWEPNSRARQMAHDRMRALWKVAGWSWPEQITTMRGNGKAAADPAGAMGFQDAEIEELRERISRSRLTGADLVAWDCMIAFGLRPAELKGLELRQQGRALVAEVAHENVVEGCTREALGACEARLGAASESLALREDSWVAKERQWAATVRALQARLPLTRIAIAAERSCFPISQADCDRFPVTKFFH